MIQILKSVPFFRELSESDLQAIVAKVIMEYYPANHVLFNEGDPAEKMYLIKRGSVEVIRGKRVVAELGTGEFFGEMALVSDDTRNATVRTTSETELLVLQKQDFRHLLETNAGIASMVSYEVVKRFKANT
ncbi:MAG: cyclic nucleotide-binding domain-containing protein [Candidatus Peregrinibacteria bacterium]